MKAAIVLALIGTVLAAPPLRLMAKPVQDHDQYAHIFAEVRPAGQRPQQTEFQPQHHNYVSNNQVEVDQQSVEQKEQHPNFYPNHQVELEVKPVDQKPPQRLEVEIKQQHPQNSAQGHLVNLQMNRPQHLEVEIKDHHSSPNHQVELEIKPVQQRPPFQHQQNSAQGHLVALGPKPVEQKPQHSESEVPADHQPKHPQQIELEIAEEDKPISSYLQSLPHFNLNLRQ
ncbi:ataxin-2 homolog [Drosophila takahashii]|uniref:ataxin-2 homolog n=1 Tax=Drosophila takahashii TaxID=29030 RepID=UPI001CF80A7E|nr:ataxin-2 homolog [Drosophila takahashii]